MRTIILLMDSFGIGYAHDAAPKLRPINAMSNQINNSKIIVNNKHNVAALTAVTAIGTAIGIVLDMSEVHRAFATLTRAAVYLYIIYKI